MATSLKKINAALASLGADAVLVKGHGYFYFVGPDTEGWYSASVFVNRVSQSEPAFHQAVAGRIRAQG